ncbi:MAG: hypothetical protein WHT29_05465 [Bacteroidales bacterium]|nr:hypothetical protein [Bacteroidales bacterium]HOK97809.1 hypothetical protein [Bacteroidales bacterium]HPO64575.1 hypothetical protein [Bacteroidales bacterium]
MIKVLYIIAFAFVFLLTYILLDPFRMHRKRPYSTIALKLSFLVYLVFALIITYLFLFNYSRSVSFFEDIENPRASLHFTLYMITLIVPTLGIFLRRKFNRRTTYNIIFTIVNILCILYYLLLVKIAFDVNI